MRIDLKNHVAKAIEDMRGKSLKRIQAEAAMSWTIRACAATALDRIEDAQEFAHEAIEHAALCGDDSVLKLVRTILRSRGFNGV